MLNIVVAPDSFKGSITSREATEVMKQAILDVDASFEVVCKPMADGGEGTLDALFGSTEGERIPMICTGPLGETIQTSYGILASGTAVIEGAAVAGLVQVPKEKRNPDHTTSFGIGEVILDALDKGCSDIIIGIGGSATNDGGMGMLQALGMKIYDKSDQLLGIFGNDLKNVQRIDVSGLDARLSEMNIQIACDVDNPLCGEKGATVVYGRQKGATSEQVQQYDSALDSYSQKLESILGKSFKYKAGAGAAGGLGFALLAIGANLMSGAKLVANATGIAEAIKYADVVITGEGQSDVQTLYGKAPGYVASIANQYQIPVVLLSGSIVGDTEELRKTFSGCFSITAGPITLEECMGSAPELLREKTMQIIQLIKAVRE